VPALAAARLALYERAMTTELARDARARLAEHLAADAEEAEHLARMRRLCESIADPFSRSGYEPGHFTASAFVISPDSRDLLLIYHQKLRRWLQPGGHVDAADRSLLETARREVREEVGLRELTLLRETPLDVDVHDIPARKLEPAHAHFDVRFLFRAHTRDVAAASDAEAVRWIPLVELSAELSDRSVMRAVEKLRACVP
jgi:8-oxo-dGTP pyrophosphatase MutT (NUDIX family)